MRQPATIADIDDEDLEAFVMKLAAITGYTVFTWQWREDSALYREAARIAIQHILDNRPQQ